MLLPIRWLKDYIETEKSTRELADGLTLSGSHVESISSFNKGIENVVVGKIMNIEKHPDADSLFICDVNVGSENLVIVTGAKNLKKDDYVPVALVGSKLPNDILISKTNFRGVDSYGMLCSLKELGYSDNVIPKEVRDGIYVFDKEYPLGSDVVQILSLDDQVIEFEITPNRPDCLSIIGMARETAATFEYKLNEPEIIIKNEVDNINEYFNGVEVESENCLRFYGKVIKDVKIKESPLWLQIRLMEAGIRPVNNIVDITNFVMLEFGEPLHAYNLEKLQDKKIIVRQAKDNEILTTLDGTDRKLDDRDLIIADGKNPIGIAGIMGGFDSEITNDTKIVFLEGANFSSKSVRLTSKKFNLRTEASTRNEKGIDPNLCSTAVDRACQLIEKIGAGTVIKGNVDIYNNKAIPKVINIRPDRVNKLLGLNISVNDMVKYLNNLYLPSSYDGNLINVTVPTFRLDLEIEADLIEEIGRLYGFHNIVSQPLKGALTRGEKSYSKEIEEKMKGVLSGFGFNEVMTYSFISPKAYDKINLPLDSVERKYIKLINPLGEDYSVMRTTLLPNMMDLLSRNYNRGVESVFAYEIGNIFIPQELPISNLPLEKRILSIGFYGERDFFYLKEIITKLLDSIGIKNLVFVREENNSAFHPGRTAKILVNGEELGILGEVHIDVTENYDINKKIYACLVDFDKIVYLSDLKIKYKPLPKYPSMNRDIALVVKEDIMVGDIENIILKHGSGLIDKIQLFDIYRGGQIEEGLKSVAYSITYRSYERTLTDVEVNNIQNSIIKDLENSLEAKLRS